MKLLHSLAVALGAFVGGGCAASPCHERLAVSSEENLGGALSDCVRDGWAGVALLRFGTRDWRTAVVLLYAPEQHVIYTHVYSSIPGDVEHVAALHDALQLRLASHTLRKADIGDGQSWPEVVIGLRNAAEALPPEIGHIEDGTLGWVLATASRDGLRPSRQSGRTAKTARILESVDAAVRGR